MNATGMKCSVCHEQLLYTPGRGYHHQQGGTYTQRCPDCGWRAAIYPSAVCCPMCGSRKVLDDHCVQPVPAR